MNDAPAPGQATLLLEAAMSGDRSALDRLLPLVYDELRSLARGCMRREGPGHILQTTALVNEACVRMLGAGSVEASSRAHFLGIAAHGMRQVLVDHARKRDAFKRGGDWQRVTLGDEAALAGGSEDRALDVLALDQALSRLEHEHPRRCRVAELRAFAGLTIAETAGLLSVSTDTVEDDWAFAKAWLARELGGAGGRRA
jgi:RNA polymerase sigma factor (TIGR02999 family)